MNRVGQNLTGQESTLYKDAVLDRLAARANVAQFVSFDPLLEQRFARIHGYEANRKFASVRNAIEALLAQSLEGSVNIRSFQPENPKSREFIYAQKDAGEVEGNLRRLAAQGLHTIVNETIDVCDGGVSGVLLNDVLEFAPCDTPRAVEKPGTVALPRDLGLRLLKTIYGFTPALDHSSHTRVEWSIHPLRRGFLHKHTIIWELEEVGISHAKADIRWPNLFSRFIGDKAFGLLIADLLGLPVPNTSVISRNLAPFRFGRSTGTAEVWIRTCPVVQMPGKFTTQRGWRDPFELMATEDPDGEAIASVLAQEGVEAEYSGALVTTEADGAAGKEEVTIEGTRGFGEEFMTGKQKPTALPNEVQESVRFLYTQAAAQLGPVRMEWVVDSEQVWVVQLHRGATKSSGSMIYPGTVSSYHRFEVERGLEALRDLISEVKGTDKGITLVGDVGVTSHFGDVLRRAEIPSRIVPASSEDITPS